MTAIGVTGHRFLTDPDDVIQGIDKAFSAIRQVFPTPYILYSSLAEGADRLAAHKALAYKDTRLIAPLPIHKMDYLAEFLSEESRKEFLFLLAHADQVIEMAPKPSRHASYEAAGHFILDHCQVLLAIWDGKQARGRGGTGQVITEARQRGLPIAWVKTHPYRPGKDQLPAFNKGQKGVIFERFPDASYKKDSGNDES